MQLNTLIDHTLLKPEATEADVQQLCLEAKENKFKAVCVNPSFVKLAAQELSGTETAVCTVVGFPLGANLTDTKVFEAARAIADGAEEIDMVVNVGDVKAGYYEKVKTEIEQLVQETHKSEKILKVIFEISLLNNEEIVKLCQVCKEASVDFVKTSTGFGAHGATVEAVKLMRESVGEKIGVKASGGVRSKEDAMKMIEVGATRLGTSSGVKIMQEL